MERVKREKKKSRINRGVRVATVIAVGITSTTMLL
jgi:hypothetical protein